METKRPAVVAAVVLFMLGATAYGRQQLEKTELQGTWIGVQSQVAKSIRTFKPGEMSLVFDAAKLTATGLLGPSATVVEFRVDSTKMPKEFDYTRKPGDVAKCIYELSGDTLTIALTRATNERPKTIDPNSDAQIVLTLKRQK